MNYNSCFLIVLVLLISSYVTPKKVFDSFNKHSTPWKSPTKVTSIPELKTISTLPYKAHHEYDFAFLIAKEDCYKTCGSSNMEYFLQEFKWMITKPMLGYLEFMETDQFQGETLLKRVEIEQGTPLDDLKEDDNYCLCLSKSKYDIFFKLSEPITKCDKEVNQLNHILDKWTHRLTNLKEKHQPRLNQCFQQLQELKLKSKRSSCENEETSYNLDFLSTGGRPSPCHTEADLIENIHTAIDHLQQGEEEQHQAINPHPFMNQAEYVRGRHYYQVALSVQTFTFERKRLQQCVKSCTRHPSSEMNCITNCLNLYFKELNMMP